jgi:phenylacetate-CoA ligase
MNKDTIWGYTNLIKRAKPKFYWGYPTAIFAFAQIVDELEIELPEPRGVLCGSQMILAGQKSFLERMFGCRVFTWYGLSEKVILASECELSTNYHIVPEYGYTEILNGTDVISEADIVGELVGTGFYNEVMPLIRYRTGDLASYCIDDNCRCNRQHKMLNTLKGRIQDLIILSDGSLRGISGDSPDLAILLDYSRGYQFVQNKPGMVELMLIPKDNIPLDYKERIYKSLRKKYFALVDFVIHEADKLVTTESGKTKFLVQNLNIQEKE